MKLLGESRMDYSAEQAVEEISSACVLKDRGNGPSTPHQV